MLWPASFSEACNRIARKPTKDNLSERVQRTLIHTLYAQPASLAIGAINGIGCTAVTALVSNEPLILYASLLLSIIAICRVIAATSLSPSNSARSPRQLQILYEIGAFSYSFVLSIIAAMTLLLRVEPALQMLMIANALCYGVGVCARDAGRPGTVMWQLTLTVAPIFIACLMIGTLPFLALAATIALLWPAMASITYNVFKVLRDSIGSAETNAHLAERMRRLARTDVVTGLANRAGHNHDLVDRLMRLDDGKMMALFWLDLDRFKEVNDLLGHPVGDRVLREVAERLSDIAPDNAAISRFGGDEFIMFCEVADRKETERLASELHAEIMRPMRIDRERLEVNASIGVAMLPDDGVDADALMQNADLALYHAKANGRKQTCFYDSTMSRDLARRREIEAELRVAIQRDETVNLFPADRRSVEPGGFAASKRWCAGSTRKRANCDPTNSFRWRRRAA